MRRWACALGVAAAIGSATGSAGTLQDGGRIVLRGEGSGTVHYVAQGPGLPGGSYEADCPEACSVSWPLQGLTITLTATPLDDSRFGGWGGMCAAAGKNRMCTFTGVAGRNEVEARFDPPKIELLYPPLRGTTTVRLSPTFVAKLGRQGWRLKAIAPGRLQGRKLTLPIVRNGPLTISRISTPLQIEKSVRECFPTILPKYVVHHGGGLRLIPPGGKPSLPLDKPAFSSLTGQPSLLFREGRDSTMRTYGKGRSLGRVGFAVLASEGRNYREVYDKAASAIRVVGLSTKLWASSWDGLVENSAKPAIMSGAFGTVELTFRIPPKACS